MIVEALKKEEDESNLLSAASFQLLTRLVRDRNNTSSDSSRAGKADCSAACSSSLRVLRIERSSCVWSNVFCMAIINLFISFFPFNRVEVSSILALSRCSYQLARSADPTTHVRLWSEVRTICKPRTSLQKKDDHKQKRDKLIFGENFEIVKKKTLPKKHTEITMKTDDRKENAAFKPSIKFISCFSSD